MTQEQLLELAAHIGPWGVLALVVVREVRTWVAHLCEGAQRGVAVLEHIATNGLSIYVKTAAPEPPREDQ